jgi:hypothetical protein
MKGNPWFDYFLGWRLDLPFLRFSLRDFPFMQLRTLVSVAMDIAVWPFAASSAR